MRDMNVYDFDKTVFLRESSTLFFRFCAARQPLVLLWLPVTGLYGLLCLLRLTTLTRFKEVFHGYLRILRDPQTLLREFWDRYETQIPGWLRSRKAQGDLVISASPEFLIAGLCERLGFRWIGTRMDPHSGHITGLNCRAEEKVRRFREAYPQAVVEVFYSDSFSDSPMAAIAKQAYLVRGEQCSPWPIL